MITPTRSLPHPHSYPPPHVTPRPTPHAPYPTHPRSLPHSTLHATRHFSPLTTRSSTISTTHHLPQIPRYNYPIHPCVSTNNVTLIPKDFPHIPFSFTSTESPHAHHRRGFHYPRAVQEHERDRGHHAHGDEAQLETPAQHPHPARCALGRSRRGSEGPVRVTPRHERP